VAGVEMEGWWHFGYGSGSGMGCAGRKILSGMKKSAGLPQAMAHVADYTLAHAGT